MIDKNILNLSENKKYGASGSKAITMVHTPVGSFYSKEFTITADSISIVPCDINGEKLSYDDLLNILKIKNEK